MAIYLAILWFRIFAFFTLNRNNPFLDFGAFLAFVDNVTFRCFKMLILIRCNPIYPCGMYWSRIKSSETMITIMNVAILKFIFTKPSEFLTLVPPVWEAMLESERVLQIEKHLFFWFYVKYTLVDKKTMWNIWNKGKNMKIKLKRGVRS